MELKICIILGSVRSERKGIRAAKFFMKAVQEYNWQVDFIDPLDYDLPLLDKRYFEMENPEQKFKELHEKFKAADGFLIITAEYNHSIPPALKNMLDHFYKEYHHKSSAIVSYSTGSFGGVRVAEILRLTCSALKMPSIPASFPIPQIGKNLTDKGEPEDSKYYQRAKKFLSEFEWYIKALKKQREQGLPE
jgi:NAD(P)H-dependent FMN reductase